MPAAQAWLRLCSLSLLLAAACSYDLERFNVGGDADEDAADGGTGGMAGDGDQPGDADGDGDGDGPGDGDQPGDGDGDGDGDGPGDGDDPVPDCTIDDDCQSGFACIEGSCRFVPPERIPSGIVQTAGGGVMTGSGHHLRLRLGAPTPMGRMQGNGHRLLIGPLSGRGPQP